MKYKIIQGYVNDILPNFQEGYFDSCITDPPYHLTSKGNPKKGFASKTWDGGDIAFRPETWQAVMRVLKPGSFMMAFGGMRTYHRLVCAIEDAGMEIRDALVWMYADSRPPNLDISKAIDKEKGATRKVVGKYQPPDMKGEWNLHNAKDERTVKTFASSRNNLDITAPETDEAKLFDGYGTALKPSAELISVSMKPMIGNFVQNALEVGVSGLNINAARIPVDGEVLHGGSGGRLSHIRDGKPYADNNGYNQSPLGRWPKNVLLDDEASSMLGKSFPGVERFFYCNKASTKERNAGLPEGFVNDHPTIKPISLTTYLAKLCLPPPREQPRRILIVFSGVMSEAIGAALAGWDEVVAIEKEEEYVDIGKRRLDYWNLQQKMESQSIFDVQG